MNAPHLSERELQAAAEPSARLSAAEAAHLRACPLCQSQVAAYQQLFTALAQQPQPAFAWNFSAQVVAQLPAARPAFPWVLSGVVVLVLGMVGAFLALMGPALVPVFQSLATGLGPGLVVLAAFFVAGQGLELLARHRRQMRLLAFS
ncbi:hypothetical protein [Hymenobacter sp. B81]|uniref:hypothetical protein n=1 Tax=Hymenobacter sp. B81 TaxID=3344878 RepID=UPI0037DCEC8E